jgi:3-oxoadipate enol-lactonase
VDVDGIELHVTEVGQGPPLLFLHGLTAAADFHRGELELLGRRHRVLAPDLRGHGRSTRPAAYSIGDHVADLLGLLDGARLDRVPVVGVSMGSYLAQALAVAAPERVAALVLVVSKSNGLTTSSARVLAEHADEVDGLGPEETQLWLAQRMFAPDAPDTVRRRVLGWFQGQERPMSAAQVQAANDALAGFDFREDLPGIAVPTLVLSGGHDLFNPPAAGREIADAVPGARFEVFEDAGHFLTAEQPERFAATDEEFLGAEAG